MKIKEMDPGKEARNAYYREWRKNNPKKVKEYSDRYWAKKAQQLEAPTEEEPQPK